LNTLVIKGLKEGFGKEGLDIYTFRRTLDFVFGGAHYFENSEDEKVFNNRLF